MTDAELEKLRQELESDRVERKASLGDTGSIRQAICAFANDMPQHGLPGVLFIGLNDRGEHARLAITDTLLRTLSDMRSDGNILPFPVMTVEKRGLAIGEVAVVVVYPSDAPPVRYNGRVWIRVGPRRATATAEEERRLNEKRRASDLPFDLHPLREASLADLDVELFRRTYLPVAVAADVLAQNERTLEQQLSSLRFTTTGAMPVPTVTGVLSIGKDPRNLIPGAYVQFLRLDGKTLSDPILDQKECTGPIIDVLPQLDDLVRANNRVATEISSSDTEVRHPEYPMAAIQQVVRNAVMHRDYQTSNAPVRIYWFSDRIEIQNPGGPFGQVSRTNFGHPGITDYRNPTIAEAMRNLGFVQRFGIGIQTARKALADNGNPPLEFSVEPNHVLATIRRRP